MTVNGVKCTAQLRGAVVCAGLGFSSIASASAFDQYGASYEQFMGPEFSSPSFGVEGDALPDGRMLMVTNNSVHVESAVGSRNFQAVANFDTSQSSGGADPSFVSISPDGSMLAVGLGFGKPVVVTPIANLGTPGSPADLQSGVAADYFNVAHYDATWQDNRHLAITAGSFGSPAYVSLLDTQSASSSPVNPTIIDNIQGASGGVAFDDAGRLYTGNGGALTGATSDTGWIKAFEPSSWQSAALDFESEGTFIADVLSATSLRFDDVGNLFVGGGDFIGSSGDFGYAGILNGDLVEQAVMQLGTIDGMDPSHLKRLDPAGTGFESYATAFNSVTGELFLVTSDFVSSSMWYSTIPAPASALLAAGGLVALSRRRRSLPAGVAD